MALSSEQLKQIREQLLKQLESLPPQQANQIRNQISGLNDSEFEQFLIKNKMIREGEDSGEDSKESSQEQGKQECVFCLIIQGKIPSYKLEENKKSLAILEINPLSYGHFIVLSKEHNKLPSQAFTLANKLAKKIKSKLKPEDVKIENAKVMGHNLINIIPIYKDKKLEKKKAEEKELILLQDKLQTKKKEKKAKKPKENIPVSSLPKAPRRIP